MLIRIFVRPISGYSQPKKLEYKIDPSKSVGALKSLAASYKINELFHNDQRLADDRSIGFYQLKDDDILESCSNPLWAAIIGSILQELPADGPGNGFAIVLRTVLSFLYNSKGTQTHQPPPFATIEELRDAMKATIARCGIGPRTLELMTERLEDFRKNDAQHPDPVGHFIQRYNALRKPEGQLSSSSTSVPEEDDGVSPTPRPRARSRANSAASIESPVQKPKEQVHIMAGPGSAASRDYYPHPNASPFAVLVALSRASMRNTYSLSDEELKQEAQPFTFADLQDQGHMGFTAWDQLRTNLIKRELIRKEAAEDSRYSLLPAGRTLASACNRVQDLIDSFRRKHQLVLPPMIDVAAEMMPCVLIDERENLKQRFSELLRLEGKVKSVVRALPVGDFLFVLPTAEGEIVFPVVIERKTWDDLAASILDGRYQRQKTAMLNCGLATTFYLIEGEPSQMKNKTLNQEELQRALDDTLVHDDFVVIETSGLRSSAHFLTFVTRWLAEALVAGHFRPGSVVKMADWLRTQQTYQPSPARKERKQRAEVWDVSKLVEYARVASTRERIDKEISAQFQPHGARPLIIIEGMKRYATTRTQKQVQALKVVVANPQATLEHLTMLEPEEQLSAEMLQYYVTHLILKTGCAIKLCEKRADTENFVGSYALGVKIAELPASSSSTPSSASPPPSTSSAPAAPHTPVKPQSSAAGGAPPKAATVISLTNDDDDEGYKTEEDDRMRAATSSNNATAPQSSASAVGSKPTAKSSAEDDDADFQRALKLSLDEKERAVPLQRGTSDDDVRRAIELSLQELQTGQSGPTPTSSQPPLPRVSSTSAAPASATATAAASSSTPSTPVKLEPSGTHDDPISLSRGSSDEVIVRCPRCNALIPGSKRCPCRRDDANLQLTPVKAAPSAPSTTAVPKTPSRDDSVPSTLKEVNQKLKDLNEALPASTAGPIPTPRPSDAPPQRPVPSAPTTSVPSSNALAPKEIDDATKARLIADQQRQLEERRARLQQREALPSKPLKRERSEPPSAASPAKAKAPPTIISIDDDEKFARQLQEEEERSLLNSGSSNPPVLIDLEDDERLARELQEQERKRDEIVSRLANLNQTRIKQDKSSRADDPSDSDSEMELLNMRPIPNAPNMTRRPSSSLVSSTLSSASSSSLASTYHPPGASYHNAGAPAPAEGAPPAPSPRRSSGSKKCGACGKPGHTRSNLVCPMYNHPHEVKRREEFNRKKEEKKRKAEEDAERERKELEDAKAAIEANIANHQKLLDKVTQQLTKQASKRGRKK